MSIYALEPNKFDCYEVEPGLLLPKATAVLSMIAEHQGFGKSYSEWFDLRDAFHKAVAAAEPRCKSFFL